MQTIAINKESLFHRWVLKFASFDNWDIDNGRIDSCMYNTAIFKSLLLSLVVGTMLTSLSVSVFMGIGDLLGWIFACLHAGMWIQLSHIGEAALIMVTIVTTIASVIVGAVYLTNSEIRMSDEHREMYSMFKDKYCKKITFKGEENVTSI